MIQLSRRSAFGLLGLGAMAATAPRATLGLTRASAVVSAVGSSFSLDKGLQPGELAA